MTDDNQAPTPPEVISKVTEEVTEKFKKRPWLKWAAGGGLLVLLIIILVLAGVFKQDEVSLQTEQWQQYHSDSLGFSVSYPANWTVTETDAASGPDILIAEQGGSAFVRIRGFLDVDLNSTDAIQASIDQYQEIIALQPGSQVSSIQSETAGEHVSEFTMTGAFPLAGSTYTFEEKGFLATTGRVLLMRAANLPANFDDSLPAMREIMASFSFEQDRGAMFTTKSAFAQETSRQPFASLGNVTFDITDYQANSVAVTNDQTESYASTLQGNIVNAGIPLGARGATLDRINQLREENNQLNQGQGGRQLITDQNGDTFWGYQRYSGNVPDAAYRIDANINVFYRDASGERQDLLVSVRIYDATTGQLVGTAQASRENTQRIRNDQFVGPEPTWWQRYISGYAAEITYEDVLRTVISEAASNAVSQLASLSNQDFVSDADRFAESLAASGYIPIVPDEIRRQSEGRGDQTGQNLGYGEPVNSVQSGCSYQTIQTSDKGYGPRCFSNEAEAYWFHQVYLMTTDYNEIPINHPLSESGISNLGAIIKQNRAEFCSFNPEPCKDIPGGFASISQYAPAVSAPEPYVDPELEAYNKWLDCVRYLDIDADSSHCSALINDSQSDPTNNQVPSGSAVQSR